MITAVYTLTILALAGCVLATGCAVAGRMRACAILFAAAWCAALGLFAADWALAQAPPFGNMRHVLAFFPLVMAPAALYLRRFRGLPLDGWLAGASAIALTGALCMPLQAAWRQMPALQSPWFAPHVTAYVISYGLMTVAALLALASCAGHTDGRMRAADAVARLAFPFMTFGLWSGAIWADAAWGRYWAWDIKEAWALITWAVYLLYFHLYNRPAYAGWRRPLLIAGFAAVVVTFLVVNLLPNLNSLHSYAG